MDKTEGRAGYIRNRLREFRKSTGNKMSSNSFFVDISTKDLWALKKKHQGSRYRYLFPVEPIVYFRIDTHVAIYFTVFYKTIFLFFERIAL